MLFFAQTPTADLVKRRAMGAYLGFAIGDALGATVEFLTPREIQHQYRVHRNIIGGGWLRLRRGQITDDTGMSLALGRSILRHGQIDARHAAEAFSEWMSGKPVDIGNTVRRGIASYRRTGRPLMEANEFDAGNGACMRCLPIALATLGADLASIDAANRRQAHVTHNNPASDAGTLCVIRMVQTALLGGDKQQLKQIADQLVEQDPSFSYHRKRCENPSAYIVETLRAVFQALFATDGLEASPDRRRQPRRRRRHHRRHPRHDRRRPVRPYRPARPLDTPARTRRTPRVPEPGTSTHQTLAAVHRQARRVTR